MELRLEDELAIKQYLLGDLTGEEQQQLEERLLTDDEYFERLQLIEDELVDEYTRGVLPPGEREKFDSYFLSTPERYQKLRFASALRRYVSTGARVEQPEAASSPAVLSLWQLILNSFRGHNPRLAYSLAAVLLVIVLGGTWSIVTNSRLQNQLETTRSNQTALQEELQSQRERADRLARELERERVQRALLEQERKIVTPSIPGGFPATTLSLALTPGLLRGGDTMKRLIVPSGIIMIRLELQLQRDEYKSYKAGLHNDDGAEVFTFSMLRAVTAGGSKIVPVIFTAENISGGDYYVQLSGIAASGNLEDLGKYFLRIIKK